MPEYETTTLAESVAFALGLEHGAQSTPQLCNLGDVVAAVAAYTQPAEVL